VSNQKLQRHAAHDLIPGGAHTYSKGDDQFPSNAPRFLVRGEGARVWDDQDNRFVDWTMGLRTMTLGYGNQAVNEAAKAQIDLGSNFARPSPIESELAKTLVDLIPCADMVKFAKNGSSVTTAALKLARAHTGRAYICYCRDHPFFSYDDWFIATTEAEAGVGADAKQYSLGFNYNDLESLADQFAAHPDAIAAVILEPATSAHPAPGFLEGLRTLCDQHGVVLIFDEMITGFRWDLRGAQHYYGVTPDLATFGKGIANGFSVSALVGAREIMERGGMFHDQARVFLMSTTHGAENHCLAAALAAIEIMAENDVTAHLWRIGAALTEQLNQAAETAGVGEHVVLSGVPCSPYFACRDAQGAESLAFRTLFLQEMVRHGVLMNYVVPSFAHGDDDIALTVRAAEQAFSVYAKALVEGVENYLEGPPIKPVFRRYN